jgi:hypothetical protein
LIADYEGGGRVGELARGYRPEDIVGISKTTYVLATPGWFNWEA